MHSIKDHKVKIAVITLFVLNLLMGVIFINEGIFHYDSVILAKAVEGTYKTGVLQPAVKGRYGAVLINSILYLPAFLLKHNADFTIRFVSVLFHSLSIVILFLFINELFADSIQAFFGSLLFSFTPFYFSPNTYGKEHGMSVFFLLLSFYLLTRGIKNGSLLLLGISSFFFVFSVSVRESILATAPLYFLLYLNPCISFHPFRINIPKERFNPKSLTLLLLPFLLFLCMALLTSVGSQLHAEVFARDIKPGLPVNYFRGIFSPGIKLAVRDLLISIPLLLFPVFIIGVRKMASKEKPFLVSFLLLWVMLILYFGNIRSYAPRYLDISVIPVYIFVSYALSAAYNKYKMATIMIVIYFVASMFLFMYPMLSFRHRYNGEKQFASYVKENTENNAVIVSIDDGAFIEYYGQRQTLFPPVGDVKKIADFIKRIDGYLLNKVPVYVTQSAVTYDPGNALKEAINRNFNVSIVGEKLYEDYHRPELSFQVLYQKLFKLNLKKML